jgi:protein-disulfide isomerase
MEMFELNPENKRLTQIFGWAFLSLLVIIAGTIALEQVARWRQSAGEAAVTAAGNIPKDEFERRVHDYLLAHPEVVSEAMHRLEAQQHQQEVARGRAALKSHADQVFHDPADPVGGNPNGDATLVEFFDYNCPYCKQMAPVMAQAEESDRHLRIVYKEYPILGPGSVFAAKAALAANQQGKYVAFHRALYELRGPLDENKILEAAKAVGLDIDRLKLDMQAPDISARLGRNIELAQTLGITGTPGFAVGNRVFSGATDLKWLQEMIAEARRLSATR